MEDFNLILSSSGLNSVNNYVSDEMYELAEKISRDKTVMILTNAAPEGSNNFVARENVKDNFLKLGAKKVEIVDIDDENIDGLVDYDVIYGLGGDPGLLIELSQKLNLRSKFMEFFKKGGFYLGESAGSMIMTDDLKSYYEVQRGLKPKWDRNFSSYAGLGFTKTKIFPHWDVKVDSMEERLGKYENETGEKFVRLNNGEFILEKAKVKK